MLRSGGTIRQWGWGLVLEAMALIGLACSPNLAPDPNEKSGDDGERSKAQLIELGAPVNDNVNFNDGDMTDWKYFQIPSPGRVMVTLGCDYTGAYCGANIRDEVGVLVTRMRTDGEPRVSEEVAVQRGNYYLEIFVPSAATDYTVQVNYEPN